MFGIVAYVTRYVWHADDVDEPTITREFTEWARWEPGDGPMIDWAVSVVKAHCTYGKDSYSACPPVWYPHGWYSDPAGSVAHDHYTGEMESRTVHVEGASSAIAKAIHYAIINA